jgi:hypothetical protein
MEHKEGQMLIISSVKSNANDAPQWCFHLVAGYTKNRYIYSLKVLKQEEWLAL